MVALCFVARISFILCACINKFLLPVVSCRQSLHLAGRDGFPTCSCMLHQWRVGGRDCAHECMSTTFAGARNSWSLASGWQLGELPPASWLASVPVDLTSRGVISACRVVAPPPVTRSLPDDSLAQFNPVSLSDSGGVVGITRFGFITRLQTYPCQNG